MDTGRGEREDDVKQVNFVNENYKYLMMNNKLWKCSKVKNVFIFPV